jgi:hypothetical protein
MSAMIVITITVGGIITIIAAIIIIIIITARTAITITTIAGIIITTMITIATMTIDDVAWLNHVAGVHHVDKLNLFPGFPDGGFANEICTCKRSTC